MDPMHLLKDEVQVELYIRGIASNDPRAITILEQALEEEASGLRMVPVGLPASFRTVTSELGELQWKFSSIVLSSSDVVELAVCRSRLFHILGRINRLIPHSGGHTQLAILKADVETSLSRFTEFLGIRLNLSPTELALASLGNQADKQRQVLMDSPQGQQPGGQSQLSHTETELIFEEGARGGPIHRDADPIPSSSNAGTDLLALPDQQAIKPAGSSNSISEVGLTTNAPPTSSVQTIHVVSNPIAQSSNSETNLLTLPDQHHASQQRGSSIVISEVGVGTVAPQTSTAQTPAAQHALTSSASAVDPSRMFDRSPAFPANVSSSRIPPNLPATLSNLLRPNDSLAGASRTQANPPSINQNAAGVGNVPASMPNPPLFGGIGANAGFPDYRQGHPYNPPINQFAYFDQAPGAGHSLQAAVGRNVLASMPQPPSFGGIGANSGLPDYRHCRPAIPPNDSFHQFPYYQQVPGAGHSLQAPERFGNPVQGLTMSKWPLRFAGSSVDLPVDEFIFRTETLARLTNLPQAALTLGVHQLLTGAAAAWYWVFIRNSPDATWLQVRQALSFAFQSNVSDAAIRRMIMDRLQRPGERFMDFVIAVQGLEVRLAHRMGEVELLETLKRNMLPHVQDRLLFVQINSVLELQQRVRQVEELVQRQAEVQKIRGSFAKIHELSVPSFASSANEMDPAQHFGQQSYQAESYSVVPRQRTAEVDTVNSSLSNPFGGLSVDSSASDSLSQPTFNQGWVDAVGHPSDRNQLTVCWNCDEMGHTFFDCSAQRKIFCYGCGAKDVVRPQCPKCSVRTLQGNFRRNARQIGLNPSEKIADSQAFRKQY